MLQNTPRHLLLNIGSNNISQAKTPNQVTRPLWYTLEAFLKNPQTNIIINVILYRNDIPKRKIADVNAALSLVCHQLKTNFLN